MASTAKVIELKGNPKKPESAEHIINFPGGSISVCRTSDQKYWAHITVFNDQKVEDISKLSKIGKIESIRMDGDPERSVEDVDPHNHNHFAVLISTS